jgi:hypothetical protein
MKLCLWPCALRVTWSSCWKADVANLVPVSMTPSTETGLTGSDELVPWMPHLTSAAAPARAAGNGELPFAWMQHHRAAYSIVVWTKKRLVDWKKRVLIRLSPRVSRGCSTQYIRLLNLLYTGWGPWEWGHGTMVPQTVGNRAGSTGSRSYRSGPVRKMTGNRSVTGPKKPRQIERSGLPTGLPGFLIDF